MKDTILMLVTYLDINSIMDPYLSWIAQLVRALARKANGPGSSPGPE